VLHHTGGDKPPPMRTTATCRRRGLLRSRPFARHHWPP